MKNPTYHETVARNHARIAAMLDKRSADMFAAAGAPVEDLTLRGELAREAMAEVITQIVDRTSADAAKQGELFP